MLPQITLAQIRDRATAQSYARGESYYQNEAIFDTVRRGNELEGRSEGSGYTPYHVRTTLDEDGNILTASCTCDYDWGGDCKHIVALLLTYLHEPGLFEERAPVQDALAERSPEELVALIRQMVARYPDLQQLIDRPTPARAPADRPVDTTPFRRELRQAVYEHDDRGYSTAEETISSVASAAREFAAAGKWRDAGAIYRAILEECLLQHEYLDDEGETVWALNSVLEGLVECLERDEIAGDDGERRAILDRLLDAFIWNVELGGQGLGDGLFPDALLGYIRPEELAGIRARVLAAQQRKAQSAYGQWGVEVYERFLIQLDALDNTDPEQTLQRLREQGIYRLLFEKLLAMGRSDEAITVVAEHLTNPFERLQVLPNLVAAGRDDEAIELGRATLRNQFDGRLAAWLAERYEARGERNELFALWLQGMQESPHVGYYATLKNAAQAVDAWANVRPEVLRKLSDDQQYAVLTQIHLYDEEWDAAWETLERIPQQPSRGFWSGWGANLDLEVAQKSQHARPQKAIPVFVKYARREIAAKDRSHYRQAAVHLATVRALYEQLGDEPSWRALIAGIRDEFRTLRALQDELSKAGL
jgi:uncharacterized Zn finger protein